MTKPWRTSIGGAVVLAVMMPSTVTRWPAPDSAAASRRTRESRVTSFATTITTRRLPVWGRSADATAALTLVTGLHPCAGRAHLIVAIRPRLPATGGRDNRP